MEEVERDRGREKEWKSRIEGGKEGRNRCNSSSSSSSLKVTSKKYLTQGPSISTSLSFSSHLFLSERMYVHS